MNTLSRQRSRAIARPKAGKTAGDRVFEVAADLFYRESIRSVGVDTIVKKAGVAKISLYRSFDSKDDLIVAYLESRNADYWRSIDRILATKRDDPRARLRALISYVADRTTMPGYRGCPFVNYASEFPDVAHPGHRVVGENKREMRRRLAGLTKAIGSIHPTKLADALFVLVEGAYASSQTLGGRNGPAAHLLWAADRLIEAA